MDQHEINQREWSSDGNWRFGIYRAPLDDRVWVPKRRPWMGWTLNFAHRAALWWLIVLLSPAFIVVGLCVVASFFGKL